MCRDAAAAGLRQMSRVQRLERLAGKYEELLRLRERRDELEAGGDHRFPPAEASSRKAAFRRIARAFPGALRELDSLPAVSLAARAERVRRAAGRCAAGLPLDDDWVELVLDFHLSVREALLVKRWLATRGPTDAPARLAAFTARLQKIAALRARLGLQEATTPAELGAWLELRHRPPRGRLLDLVWAELEERHGAPRASLERRLFGDR